MGLFGKTSSVSSGGVDAVRMRKAFTDHMDNKGIKYTVMDEDDNIVMLSFGGSKFDTIVMVDFDENTPCDSVHFNSQSFAKCDKSMIPACIIKLNELNRRFRWVKFWVDEEGKLTADGDSMCYLDSVGESVTHSCFRFSNILEDALESLKGVAEEDKETAQMLRMAALIKGMK